MTDYLLVCEHPCKRKKLASPRTICDQTVAQTWLMDSKQLITSKHLTFSAPAEKLKYLVSSYVHGTVCFDCDHVFCGSSSGKLCFPGSLRLTNSLQIPKIKIYSQNQTEDLMDLWCHVWSSKEDVSGQQQYSGRMSHWNYCLFGVLVTVIHVWTSICISCQTYNINWLTDPTQCFQICWS